MSSSSTVRFATTAALSHASLLGAKKVIGVSSVSFSPACEQHQQRGHNSSSSSRSNSMQKLGVNAPAAGNSAAVLNAKQGAASLVSFRPAHKLSMSCGDARTATTQCVTGGRWWQCATSRECKPSHVKSRDGGWSCIQTSAHAVHGARLPEARQH